MHHPQNQKQCGIGWFQIVRLSFGAERVFFFTSNAVRSLTVCFRRKAQRRYWDAVGLFVGSGSSILPTYLCDIELARFSFRVGQAMNVTRCMFRNPAYMGLSCGTNTLVSTRPPCMRRAHFRRRNNRSSCTLLAPVSTTRPRTRVPAVVRTPDRSSIKRLRDAR